jgi:hypothetical protein
MGPVLVQLFVKLRGLQVMDQGKQRTRPELGYQVAIIKWRKNGTKQKAKKGLNKNFIAPTKLLENRAERVGKTDKRINKQAVHLD